MSNVGDADLYQRNMMFFKEFSPDVHRRLLENGRGNFQLSQIGDKSFDVVFNGKRFYGDGAALVAQNQVQDFWEKQHNRIFVAPDQTNENGVVSRFFISIMNKATTADITFFEKRCDLRSYHLIVFGAGLGLHLPLLVDLLECKSLTIIEPNLDLFHASLHTFDWQAFRQRFPEEHGYNLNLLITDDAVLIYDQVRAVVKYQRAPAFVDGFCLFQHYEAEAFQLAGSRIFKTPKTLFSDFGFLYDQLNMLQNTYFNLRDNNPLIFQSADSQIDVPVFVVGAGPSLDASMEVIRAHKDRVIIVSCGTALMPLLEDGIIPDFHAELENMPDIYDITAGLAKKHDLSKVNFIGTTSVFPTVTGLFDHSILFFRDGIASNPIFKMGSNSTVPYSAPLVSNLGTSFAGQIGCKRIYLFGIDLGTMDRDRHYAKNTSKARGQSGYKWDDGLNIKVPANFGGTALTVSHFVESLTFLEEDIRHFGESREYFNCSDGIAIGGATPLRPLELSIGDGKISKSAAIAEIVDRCRQYTPEMFAASWNGGERVAANKKVKELLTEALLSGGDGYNGTLQGLFNIADEMPFHTKSGEIMLYQGSMITALASAYFFLCRTGNDDDRAKFSSIVQIEFIALISEIADLVEEFYERLRDPNQAKMEDYIEIH